MIECKSAKEKTLHPIEAHISCQKSQQLPRGVVDGQKSEQTLSLVQP